MNNYSNKYLITTGDPNGIGAEVTIKALNALKIPKEEVVLVSNRKILSENGVLSIDYEVIEVPYNGFINAGIDTKEGGEFSYRALEIASSLRPKAIITGPVSKKSMHLAGYNFNGQTEVLEHFLANSNQKAEMLFVCDDFRVLLLTRHEPILGLNITKDLIVDKISRLNKFFREKTTIKNPKFAICALNPHAGENGVIGTEEIDIINPALIELKECGINVSEPISADVLMPSALVKYLKGERLPYDCYIAMYHDQGLIPIKSAGMDNVVNMTIGLDIIRTSPSHGTAFDIAGKFIASADPMITAIKQATNI